MIDINSRKNTNQMNEKIIIDFIHSNQLKNKINKFVNEILIQTFKKDLIDDIISTLEIDINFKTNNMKNNKVENSKYILEPSKDSLLPIYFEPKNEDDFKQKLLISKSANIEIFYNDNRSEVKKWKANRFKDSSSVIGNLRSRLEFRNGNWQERNISYVKVYIGDYKQNENRVPIMTNKKREVNGMKIGKFVKHSFDEAYSLGLISEKEITNLQNSDYSKKIFNSNFEILRYKKISIKDNTGISRYYNQKLFCKDYYLTSQWIETQWDLYLRWLDSLGYSFKAQ